MGVRITNLPSMTTATGPTIMVGVQDSVTKQMTLTQATTYVIDVLADSTTVATPAEGDAVLLFRNGAARAVDIDDLADYVIARI